MIKTAAAFSVLMSIVCLGLWIGSFYRMDVVRVPLTAVSRVRLDGTVYVVESSRAGIYILKSTHRWADANDVARLADSFDAEVPEWYTVHGQYMISGVPLRAAAGGRPFVFMHKVDGSERDPWDGYSNVTEILVPHLALVMMFALPGLIWVLSTLGNRRMRAIRTARERCAFCGYDLRHKPSHCPECGMTNEAIIKFSRVLRPRDAGENTKARRHEGRREEENAGLN